ncbi:MAG: hypothetical protein JSR78_17100 [Proteobacteria bacterium]|nr:hypothetical protein [Pseudomonadota bacterium]
MNVIIPRRPDLRRTIALRARTQKTIAGKSQVRNFIVRNPCVAAERWNGESNIFEQLHENFGDLISRPDGLRIVVATPDGEHVAMIGDWVVQDASGTVFVMQDDIFNRKFKPLA